MMVPGNPICRENASIAATSMTNNGARDGLGSVLRVSIAVHDVTIISCKKKEKAKRRQIEVVKKGSSGFVKGEIREKGVQFTVMSCSSFWPFFFSFLPSIPLPP